MARRGEELRRHILWTAKDVFLELGFERTSMDVVASRAGTSKRSVYAHFRSKENLYSAIVELVRGLLLTRLGDPADHADDPVEALAIFLARYTDALTVGGSIQMFRLNAAEAARFPAGAAQYFEIVFAEVEARIAAFGAGRLSWPAAHAERVAQALIGQALFPRLPRAVFGLEPLAPSLREDPVPEVDLAPLRAAVTTLSSSSSTVGPSVAAPDG